jgi:hypothetical protein
MSFIIMLQLSLALLTTTAAGGRCGGGGRS